MNSADATGPTTPSPKARRVPIDFFEGQRQVNNWGGRMNAFRRSSVFKKTLASVSVLAAYVVAGHILENYFEFKVALDFTGVTLLGGVLSLLLVFRSNSAYDRWWEGRKLWGKLVNDCRNLAIKITVMSKAPEEEKKTCVDWVIAFPFLLRDHLRDGIPKPDTLKLLPREIPEEMSHNPAFATGEIFAFLKRWKDQGHLDSLDHHLIDQHIAAFMDICGACERIRNTPPPLAYRAFIPQLLVLYLVVTPLGVQPTATSAVLGLGLAYFLIGIEILAEELEEPFGKDTDDLPLDTISNNIRRSVEQIRTSQH